MNFPSKKLYHNGDIFISKAEVETGDLLPVDIPVGGERTIGFGLDCDLFTYDQNMNQIGHFMPREILTTNGDSGKFCIYAKTAGSYFCATSVSGKKLKGEVVEFKSKITFKKGMLLFMIDGYINAGDKTHNSPIVIRKDSEGYETLTGKGLALIFWYENE